MGHSHHHHNKCKLAVMFTLNFGYFLVELIVGYLTNSMALVADSFHMLSDVVALVVAFIAIKISSKKWSKNTFGWARAEVLGALVNAVFLIALCFSIAIDSIKRFFNPEPIVNPVMLLIVGSIGLLMNLVGLCLFNDSHSHSHHANNGEIVRLKLTHSNRLTRMVSSAEDTTSSEEFSDVDDTGLHLHTVTVIAPHNYPDHLADSEPKWTTTLPETKQKKKVKSGDQMNIRGVFLHLLADAMGSVVVVISALVVWLVEWEYQDYIDPVLSMFMVILIVCSVYPLLVESSLILLQTVPTHIKVHEIEKKLVTDVEGVLGVHELHIWQLTGDKIIATAHIKCGDLAEYIQTAEKVKAFFHNEGIHSTTIQPEFPEQSSRNRKMKDGCYLSCSALSTMTNCSANTCCGNSNAETDKEKAPGTNFQESQDV